MEKKRFDELIELVKQNLYLTAEVNELRKHIGDLSLEKFARINLLQQIQELDNRKVNVELQLSTFPLYAIEIALHGLKFDTNEKKNVLEQRYKLTRDFQDVLRRNKEDEHEVKLLVVYMCFYLLGKDRLDLAIIAYITNDLAIATVLCASAIEDEKLKKSFEAVNDRVSNNNNNNK